ncbi:uncharacterized protein [Drosophila pseudoobscura]|uniref:Uncharacterized protein isoform X1 n=1 Tax=Drosophila pseudoobscura pseudoobscura TaxID=46245 RepID=A0A6I8UJS7_DROPS|nr:uncharacterized protein LOC4816992 isoform X1 [Drosophila pseudoobscura]
MEKTNRSKGSVVRSSRISKQRPTATPASNEGSMADVLVQPKPKPKPPRVFLYIQLNETKMLPESEHPLELHLYHAKNSLQKMQEHYTTETIIYQHEFAIQRPVFALGVMQDDMEDMNVFSDNPLVITLYRRVPRLPKRGAKERPKEADLIGDTTATPLDVPAEESASPDGVLEEPAWYEGDAEEGGFTEGHLEMLSRGHCDLLQLFQRRRFISDITVYLYPELKGPSADQTTTCTVWHMYSILPILKEFNFTNLAFVTLESVYNVPEVLHQMASELGLSISFRARVPDERGDRLVVPLCTFYGFGSEVISEQNTSIVWENIKRDINPFRSYSFNQMDTNIRVKLQRVFRLLLWEKDVDFGSNSIDIFTDLALVNNSMHRYVLNEEMRRILEAAVLHNSHELLLQLYHESPANVLYEGVLNPSIFGYPDVNYCRFASTLNPYPMDSTKSLVKRGTLDMGPMFASVKICFFQSIVQRNENLDKYNEDLLKRAKLLRCFDHTFLIEAEDDHNLLLELYRSFDDLISDMIAVIVKRDLRTMAEGQDYFCCQLANLNNLLLKICGCDFNIRMPTKTNLEFRAMLTHMYKELMERIERLLAACSWESVCNCVVNFEYEQLHMIHLMEEVRLMCLIGERELAGQIFEDLRDSNSHQLLFNFYNFLNSLENAKFRQASRYFRNPVGGGWVGEYFPSLGKLYIDYMLDLESEDEERRLQAYASMIASLREFVAKNTLDLDAYVLLYCYYKRHDYLPGMEFTRLRFENLYGVPRKNLAGTPVSLFELFLPEEFEQSSASTMMHVKFYPVFTTFARIGAYGFAEVVFDEIQSCFTATEAYLVTSTLKILQRNIDETFKVMVFPTSKSVAGKLMHHYQAHINGNVEYTRGRYDEAMRYFRELLTIEEEEEEEREYFKVSLMRLGRLAFDRGDYELANQAYDKCPQHCNKMNFLVSYGKGLALYYLNRLEEAILYLARCTEVEVFVPDVWGYLAISNLRLHRNKTALECWKMAKMYPEMFLHDRIYEELDKINYSDIHLLVDDDGNPAEVMKKKDFIAL